MMKGRKAIFLAVLSAIAGLGHSFHLLVLDPVDGSSSSLSESKRGIAQEQAPPRGIHRRGVLAGIAAQLSWLPIITATRTQAVVMENSQTVFKVGEALTMDQAETRLKEGRKSAQYLFDHYDEIINQGGGDNVRRYLGTVGTTSGLYGIGKVMNTLSTRAEDFVEYTEVADEILKSIQQADGSAYMAIFVATSTSQTPPSQYFGEAKIEVRRCIKALDDLMALIDLE